MRGATFGRDVRSLLARFDRGELDERALGWLCVLRTLDYLESPRRVWS